MKIYKIFSVMLVALCMSFLCYADDLTADVTPPSSPQASDGAIDLHVNAGVAPYFFVWSNGETTEDISNLPYGWYHVVVTDAICGVAELDILVCPNLQISPPKISCFCDDNGSIEIEEITGGSGNFDIDWTAQDPTNTYHSDEKDAFHIKEEGNYILTITDLETGCVFEELFYVKECGEFYEATRLNSCDGPGTGSIEVTVDVEGLQVGTPATFIWLRMDGPPPSPSQITTDPNIAFSKIDNLEPGRYCLTMLTNNGCQTSECWTIEESDPPLFTQTVTPVLSGMGGTINLTLNGGASPTNLVWEFAGQAIDPPPSNLYSLDNLVEGEYCLKYDYGSCNDELCINIFNCDDLLSLTDNIEGVVTPMSTALNDGAIDITVVGAEGYNLNYEWNNGETSEDLTDLSAGEYCVTYGYFNNGVNGCGDNLSNPPVCFDICGFGLTISDLGMTPGSSGDCQGILVAEVNGGSGPQNYTYQWSKGGGTSASFTYQLFGHEYCVTVTDAGGCEAVACHKTVEYPFSLSANVTNTSGASANGSISLTVDGGIEPFSYQWTHNGNPFTPPNPVNLESLAAGEYHVTVRDACNTIRELYAYVECEIPSNVIGSNITNVACSGTSLGIIEIFFNDPNYESNNIFLWNNGATTQTIENLEAGEYRVTIVNANSSCSLYGSWSVETIGNADMSFMFTPQVGCVGTNNGSIIADVTSNYPITNYQWFRVSNPDVFPTVETPIPNSNSTTLSDVEFGWYKLVVTDNRGCTDEERYFLTATQEMEITFDINPNPVCANETTTILTNITGGNTPYVFRWSICCPADPQILDPGPQNLNSVQAGHYFLTVTDSEECTQLAHTKVEDFPEIIVSEEIEHICGGNSSSLGAIFLSVNGGNSAFTFNWNNGATTANVENLQAGEYFVTVSDLNGCSVEHNYTIVNSSEPNISASVINPTCSTQIPNNGAIHLSVLNGNPPFEIFWNNGAIGNSITQLGPGNYAATIIDNFGCRSEFETELTNEEALQISVLNVVHYNPGDNELGAIDILVTGGEPPYSFSWTGPNFSNNNQNIEGLIPGDYTVVVTDSEGCTVSETIPICSSPALLDAEISIIDVFPCRDGLEGSITVSVVGGTAPFNYEWTGPIPINTNSPTISGLKIEGEYCVTVTDACGFEDTECQTMSCSCGDIGVAHIVSCSNNTFSLAKLELNGDWGIPIEDEVVTISWFNGDITILDPLEDNPPNFEIISGSIEFELEPGHYCYQLVGPFGCRKEVCFSVFESNQNILIPVLDIIGNHQEFFDPNLEIVTSCRSCSTCFAPVTPNDNCGVQEPFVYKFVNLDTPCNSGGAILACGQIINVPINEIATEFRDGDECACLFPPGLIPGYDTHHVYVEFNCSDDPITPSTDPEPGGPSYECPCPEDDCVFLPIDGECNYEVVCGDGGFIEDEIPAKQNICYKSKGHGGCKLFRQCEINPCIYEEILNCTSPNFDCTELIPEEILNQVDCSADMMDNDCKCTDLQASFPICESCSTNPIVAQGNSDYSNEIIGTGGNISLIDGYLQHVESPESRKKFNNSLITNIFPNPFTNEVTVEINMKHSGEILIQVSNILGEEVYQIKSLASKGKNIVELDFNNRLYSGIYHLIAIDKKTGEKSVHKIIHTNN